ncbi:MAG: helix-turn-helix transcriptional regulator [Bacilli bacterium]
MDVLKEKRTEAGYSCRQMAQRLNICKTFYWQLENNKRRISYEMAINIAGIFKLKPDELFYEDFKSKDN